MNRERAPRAGLVRSGRVLEREWRVAARSFERVRAWLLQRGVVGEGRGDYAQRSRAFDM